MTPVLQPVIDLHCDLLSYLESQPGADPGKSGEIGCNFSDLAAGGVKLQVMAIYSSTENGSSVSGLKQSQIFSYLLSRYPFLHTINRDENAGIFIKNEGICMVAAIENASSFCEENEPLTGGFKKLEQIIANTGKPLYIGFTHHGENRFGGGNTTKAGLKDDGKRLLNYLHDQKIAVDLSHTSDALAYGILEHLLKQGLNIPIIASHSNYREVFNHPRNLPNDLARENISRKGLIGVNFLRAFLNDTDPEAIFDHIQHGIKLGGEKAICFGADYFYTAKHPDQSRIPFFIKSLENAACYPALLKRLETMLPPQQIEDISHKNVLDFIRRLWF